LNSALETIELFEVIDRSGGDLTSPGAGQGSQQTFRILWRAQHMCRLHQALQFIGGNLTKKERGSPPFLVIPDESSAQKWWFKPT